MASPAVAGTNTSAVTSAGTSHTVNLPASISAGDLLIVHFGYVVIGQTISWPAGWNAVPSAKIEGATLAGLDIGYRLADGSEGATISVGTSASTKSAHTSYRITGAENPSTQVPESVTGATAESGANPDPPSISPTGGSKDYLFLASAFHVGESAFNVVTGIPASYSNGKTGDTGGTGSATTNGDVASAERQLTASSENPGTFAYGSATSAWVAQTVAIHPAGEGGAQSVTGTLFSKAPTFFTGVISTGAVNLSGALFQRAPTFFTGTISVEAQELTGSLFSTAPSFFVGAITTGATNLVGVLFQRSPTFFVGTVAIEGNDLTGVLFQNDPVFFQGSLTGGVVSDAQIAREAIVVANSNDSAFREGQLAREAVVVPHHFPEAETFAHIVRLGVVIAISRPHGWDVFDDPPL